MMRAIAAALLLVVAMPHAASAQVASTQVLRQQLELWAEQCANEQRAFDAQTTLRACTSIIRSDNASAGVRAFAYHRRGSVRLEQGDGDRALSDFSSAIQYNPHFAAAFISRAPLYEAQREYDRAIADYDEVVRIAPQFGPAYNARCWLKILSGRDLATARADCDRSLEMGVGAPAYDTRGLLNLREGNFAAAWEDYNEAVRAAPGDAHSLYGRGLAAARLGRGLEGQADLAAAAALDETVADRYAGYGVAP